MKTIISVSYPAVKAVTRKLAAVTVLILIGTASGTHAQSDTFDGTVLDTDKWEVSDPLIGGSVTQNDALYVTTDGFEPGGWCFTPGHFGGGAGVAMKRKLSGDFDIQVDFSDFNGGYDAYTQAFLCVYQDATDTWRGDQFSIKRMRVPGGGDVIQSVAAVNGVFPIQTGTDYYPDTFGTFRILRIGNQITSFINGSVHFSIDAFSGPVIATMSIGGPGQPGSVVYDNFLINSGTLVEPPLSCGEPTPTPTPTGSPTPECTYNPADDFSASMNPNGSWTFGYTAILGGTLILYDATKIGDGVNYWYRSDHFNAPFPPEVGHNPNGAFVQAGDIDWTANGFHLHPGPDGSFSVARWTATTSGMVDVNAVFSLADSGATDVHLLYNSVSLFNDVIVGRADSSSFSTAISVVAGDTIDLSVGPEGDYFDDSTALVATISTSCATPTPSPTPPEPSPTPTPTPTPTPACAAEVQQPIDADGSSIFNVRRGIVPLKFRLICDGQPTCNLSPATIAVTRTAGGVIGEINESVYSSQADSGQYFRVLECQYHYNLNSNALGVGTYQVDILINGEVVGSATFQLK